MNIHLISTILKSVWAIDPDAALTYAPLLNNLIGTGMKLEFQFDGQEFEPFFVNKSMPMIEEDIEPDMEVDAAQMQIIGSRWTDWNNVPEGSIAIIPMRGPLMKNDQYCGPAGMSSIGAIIKSADKAANIDAIILKIDSPGGTVDGTVELAEIIADVKKPILAFADGLMASAALWIGSATDEVIAANKKTEIGSIGVMLSFADIQPAYEKLGVVFHTIVADQSKDKNKLFEMVRQGKYEDYKKEVLNPLAADFIDAVKQNRPGVKDDQLTGKVYFAEDLVGTLIDSIGNMDYAIQRASDLAAEYKKTLNSTTKKPASMKSQYENVNKVLEVEKLEAQDEGVFLNEDQVASIDAALAQGSQDATDLQTANSAKAKAEADLAAANQSIQEKDAEIAQLKKNAGAEPAKAVSQKETAGKVEADDNLTNAEKSFEENLNAVKELL